MHCKDMADMALQVAVLAGEGDKGGGGGGRGGCHNCSNSTAINQSPMFANDIIHFQAPLPTSMLPGVCKKMLGNHKNIPTKTCCHQFLKGQLNDCVKFSVLQELKLIAQGSFIFDLHLHIWQITYRADVNNLFVVSHN